MGKHKSNCKCEERCPFIKKYFEKIFDLTDSAGSVIKELKDIFRTFQRATAARSFSVTLSKETRDMFEWATSLIQLISYKILGITPFTQFELFSIYTLSIPIFILCFISALIIGPGFFFAIFIYALTVMLGAGLGYINVDTKNAVLLCALPPFFFIIFILCLCACGTDLANYGYTFSCNCKLYFVKCCKKKQQIENENEDEEEKPKLPSKSPFRYSGSFPFSIALLPSSVLLLFLLIHSLIEREKIAFFVSILVVIVLVVSLIVEYLMDACIFMYDPEPHFSKIIIFLIECLSLLIIPSTENFIELMEEKSVRSWSCILGYIVITLLLPITMTVTKILTEYEEITRIYKKREKGINYYHYIELIKIVKDVVYAIAAGFDIPGLCIGLELAWCIFICVIRPYEYISDYTSKLGESIMTVVTNSIAINLHRSGSLSFGGAVTLVVFLFLPSIISFFIYFIIDFKKDVNDLKEIEKIQNTTLYPICILTLIISPIGWFVYGSNIPNMI